MSDYISKQAVNNWLKDEAEKAYRSADELLHEKLWIGQGQAFEAAAEALQSGRFDASNQGEAARLRESLEQIKNHEMALYAERSDFVDSYYLLQELAEQALSGDTEPVGDWIDEYCPKCGAQMLGNKIGNEWCSSVICNYGVPGINTGDG